MKLLVSFNNVPGGILYRGYYGLYLKKTSIIALILIQLQLYKSFYGFLVENSILFYCKKYQMAAFIAAFEFCVFILNDFLIKLFMIMLQILKDTFFAYKMGNFAIDRFFTFNCIYRIFFSPFFQCLKAKEIRFFH